MERDFFSTYGIQNNNNGMETGKSLHIWPQRQIGSLDAHMQCKIWDLSLKSACCFSNVSWGERKTWPIHEAITGQLDTYSFGELEFFSRLGLLGSIHRDFYSVAQVWNPSIGLTNELAGEAASVVEGSLRQAAVSSATNEMDCSFQKVSHGNRECICPSHGLRNTKPCFQP